MFMRNKLIFMFAALFMTAAGLVNGDQVKKNGEPSILMIGKRQRYIGVPYLEELNKHGFKIKSLNWDEISPDVLREFNCVLITGFYTFNTKTAFDEKKQRWIDDYMSAGGGVFVFLNTAGVYKENFHPPVIKWLSTYGLDFKVESVEEPDHKIYLSPLNIKKRKAFWADRIEKHPITKDVGSLLFPMGWGGHCAVFTCPVFGDSNWKNLIWSRSDAELTVLPRVPKGLYREKRPGGPFSLMAVRTVGLGRMAVIGINPVWVVWTPYHWSFDGRIMKKGENGRKSDFWKLLENTYSWLSEPSLKSKIYGPEIALRPPVPGATPTVDWSEKTFPGTPKKYYKGVAGIHSAYSSGKGTVKEWAEQARKNGFDYIVFTEDLKYMNKDKWEKLQADCEAVSDDKFVAYAGLEYESEAGLRGFLPWGNTRPWYFSRGYLTQDGKKIHVGRGYNPKTKKIEHTWRKGGQNLTYLNSKSNAYFDLDNNTNPFWNLKNYNIISAFTYENGKLLEDNEDKILHMNATQLNPGLYALDMLYKPEDLSKAGKNGRPFMVVSADPDPRLPAKPEIRDTLDRMAILSEKIPYYQGTGDYRGWHGPVVTQGPRARLMFRGGYSWKGNEHPRYWIDRYAAIQDEDWFMPSWYRCKFRLDAQSDDGIADIKIYDGEKLYRHFTPKGAKNFNTEFALPQDKNHHICAVITDTKGKKAITREVWMEQQQQPYNYCWDHVNIPYTIYAPIHGEPYPRRIRQFRDVEKEERRWSYQNDECRRFFADLVSPDIYIPRYRTERVYKQNELTGKVGWHNYAKSYPRDDYHFEQRAYGWFWKNDKKADYEMHHSQMPSWDGYKPVRPVLKGQAPPAELSVFDNILEPLKPMPLDKNGFIGITVVRNEFPVETGIYSIVTPDGKVISGNFKDLKEPLTGKLNSGSVVIGGPEKDSIKGDSILWSGRDLAYRIAKDEVGKNKYVGVIEVGVKPGEKNTKGNKLVWRFQRINRRVDVNSLLKPDWFKISRGKTEGLQLCELHVAAEKYTAAIEIKRAALDTNSQPVVVNGISNDASCYLYDLNKKRMRPVGVWDGKAFVQIPGSAKNVSLVIGNPFLADQPGILLDAVPLTGPEGDMTGKWTIDLHNPTSKELQVTVSSQKVFDTVPQRSEKIVIPARASKRLIW